MNKEKETQIISKVSKSFNKRVEATDSLHLKFLEHPNFLEYETDNLKLFIDEVVACAEQLVSEERNFRTTVCLAADEIRKEQSY